MFTQTHEDDCFVSAICNSILISSDFKQEDIDYERLYGDLKKYTRRTNKFGLYMRDAIEYIKKSGIPLKDSDFAIGVDVRIIKNINVLNAILDSGHNIVCEISVYQLRNDEFIIPEHKKFRYIEPKFNHYIVIKSRDKKSNMYNILNSWAVLGADNNKCYINKKYLKPIIVDNFSIASPMSGAFYITTYKKDLYAPVKISKIRTIINYAKEIRDNLLWLIKKGQK